MVTLLQVYTLLFSISLTIAVQLYGNCTSTTQCDGSNVVCTDRKCLCNSPAYIPCKSICEINSRFAYEGDPCEVDGNCPENAACVSKKCACRAGFPARNGLCLKNLNATCADDNECRSQTCTNSRCSCLPGYEPSDDNTSCKRKLVKIYNNWSDANQAEEFCIDSSSCTDAMAECISGPASSTGKFCKCQTGYRLQNNERCELVVSSLLSPLDQDVSNYGECGGCQDQNAACITAGDETTCWCRSGYQKRSNKCEKQPAKSLMIFPNEDDRSLHDFTGDCNNGTNGTTQVENDLCVCAPGYQLDSKSRSCVKIERKWISRIQEYGVCTGITSDDTAVGLDGLCPEPLKCEARKDKHVCSCGRNKFLDTTDPTRCVYFIGATTNSSTDLCPSENAARNAANGKCECIAGYRPVDESRRCEVKLSSQQYQSSCTSQFNNAICESSFGKTAVFCSLGECRCSGNQSYANKATTRCYALLNEALTSPMAECPPNSKLDNNRCLCDSGYRATNDKRECVRLTVQLVEYAGSSTNTSGALTTEDCRGLFSGPVIVYTTDRCQCISDSFINDQKDGCWYRVNAASTRVEDSSFCPPNSNTLTGPVCTCNTGFVASNNRCAPISTRVYESNDPAAPTINDLTEQDCVKNHGYAATISSNRGYCVCRSTAYPVNGNSFCHFQINQTTNDIKTARDCPANTIISPESPPSACVCDAGYYATSDGLTCRTSNAALGGSANVNQNASSNCVNFTNDDCVAKFGEGAFCQNETCFCDRQSSFTTATGQCESFSKSAFPGEHELNSYSCTSDEDCGGKENVECDYFNSASQFKVCKCKDGALLDPTSQTCTSNRCSTNCDASLNFECNGYECACKVGYYQEGNRCLQSSLRPQLYQACNRSATWQYAFAAPNMTFQCNTACERVECKPGYRPEKTQCVEADLGNTKCANQADICQQIDENSICNEVENQCWCRPSYYLLNNKCVASVGTPCETDEQCGNDMVCKGKRCDCNTRQRKQNTIDPYGRVIQTCVNGINRIQFSSFLILSTLLIRKLFF